MAKYKILIVDDEESRISTYKSLFRTEKNDSNDFELEFATKSLSEFLKKNSEDTFHCYVVDISLNGEGWCDSDIKSCDPLKHVLNDIGEKKPIVLLSSVWGEVITWLNEFIPKHNIISLIDWMAVINQNDSLVSGMIYNNILTALKKIYKFSDLNKQIDEPIRILHISDLQFGEKSEDDKDGSHKQLLVDELINEIPNYLSCTGINIDFIAVTGDITQSALPSEFDLAEEWLKKLCENIFGKYDSERLLLVNGNHDFNLSLNSLNFFEFKYGSKPLSMKKLKKPLVDYSQLSLIPYQNFLTKMTNENINSLTYYNTRFKYLGIRFLHLNTLETYNVLNSSSEDIFYITNDTFPSIIDKEIITPDNHVFTIVLSHASPNNLGYQTTNRGRKRLWERIENSVSRFNKSLFLSGHHHEDYFLTPIPVKNNGKLYSSVAPTLLSKPDEDGTRGFCVITLDRKNKKVIKITNQLFTISSKLAVIESNRTEEPIDSNSE